VATETEIPVYVKGEPEEAPVYVAANTKDFLQKRSANEAKRQYSDAELIREGYDIHYFTQSRSHRPHIDTAAIAYSLHPYGGVSPKTILTLALELGCSVRQKDNKAYLAAIDADRVVTHYITEHGAPNVTSIPVTELSRKLRVNPLTIGYLLNNHSKFNGDNWDDHLGEKLTKDENNVIRVGRTAASRVTDIIIRAQKDLGSNWVYVGVNIIRRDENPPNVYASFPKNLHNQVRLCDISIKDGEKLQLIYGTREALRYATTRRHAS